MAKLAVSNKVIVPVIFSMKDGVAIKNFDYTLICDRMEEQEFQDRIKDESGITTNAKIREAMNAITTDWEGQTFVLNDDNTPASFTPSALKLMLGASGVLDVVVKSYMAECAAKTKN